MRLTLRTLLAYLDDILEPNDRETIAGKIEESEFAKKLVHRTHDVVSRLRLGAPPVLGSGVAQDPNSVAEYLDNTMAPEQIQVFEKACLESDAQLAEATACHHVLTIAQGEPIQIEAATRERLYRLADVAVARVDRPETEESESPAAPERDMSAEIAAREQREAAADAVRQLSRDSDPDTSGKPTPAASESSQPAGSLSKFAVGFAAVAAVILMAILAFDPETRRQLFGGGDEPGDGNEVAQAEPDPDETAGDEAPSTTPVDTNDGDADSSSNVPRPDVPGPEITDDPQPRVDDPDTVAPQPEDPAPAGPSDPQPGVEPDTPTPPAPTPDTPTPPAPTPDTPIPPAPTPDTPTPDAPTPPDELPDAPPADDVSPDQVAKVDGAPDRPAPTPMGDGPSVIGRLLSSDQILLRTVDTLDKVERVGVQGSLRIGDRLLSLPLFRPMISLPSTTVELHEGTMIELAGLDQGKTPQVVVHYGRMITRSLTMPNARMQLRLGDRAGTIVFKDADSSCAFQVRPFRIVGTDPEKVRSRYAVDLYVPSGKVFWVTENGEQEITGPARMVLAAHPAEENPVAEMPSWIDTLTVGQLDKRAVSSIEQRVRAGRSVHLSFEELSEDRKVENRKLAVRCGAHIGQFKPLVRSLNDPDKRPRWMEHCDQLAAAVARDPAIAAQVRKTFEGFRDEKAFELYRMLWDYSSTGLKEGGEARKLVDFLDHEDLDYRVLSFWNLQRITGAGRNYHPEYTKNKRRRSLTRWREAFDRGEIAHKQRVAEPATAGRGE